MLHERVDAASRRDLDGLFETGKVEQEYVEIPYAAEERAEPEKFFRKIGTCLLRDRPAEQADQGSHSTCRDAGLVHEFGVDVRQDARDVLIEAVNLWLTIHAKGGT